MICLFGERCLLRPLASETTTALCVHTMSFGTRPTSAPRARPRSQSREKARPVSDDPVLGGGARGIRQLRRQRNEGEPSKENQKPQSSGRQRVPVDHNKPTNPRDKSRVEAARMYLAQRVDPLMSQIITYLLAEQPTHADEAILKYLEGKKSGVLPRPQTPKRRASSDGSARNALLRDRLYMGRKVQPVLENLMRRVVEEQPADVEGHFIKQLKASMAGKRRAKRESAAAAGRDASNKDESCNSPEVEEDITPVGGPSPRKWAQKKSRVQRRRQPCCSRRRRFRRVPLRARGRATPSSACLTRTAAGP